MLTEIPYKFKYMLNKIINCIIEFIMKNLKNDLLLESKLILINNYILEVFHTTEISGNINTKSNKSIYNAKNIIHGSFTPRYEKNISLPKFNNIFINISDKLKQENLSLSSNEKSNSRAISHFKDKNKIIKLKNLLKSEQEKSLIKELTYLKKLSFVQEKLNFYEAKNEIKDKANFLNGIENKNLSFRLIDENKKLKLKMNKSFINNLNNLTIMNSSKNKKINIIKNIGNSKRSRIIKHSMSQS